MNANRMLTYKLNNTSQVKSIIKYLNLERKLLQCNANIKFNKVCFKENIVPKYAVINVTGNTKASTNTKQKAQRLRIYNKIKYLYKNKQQINK
jgi:hypothetical protein